ncbi:MJ0042 family finger-like domain-containing protein [Desulfuromusa kysingii]|uniref:MJ0042 family finger-like domain-containing protein n=1 Tax=Desulfuromusa kysingii TaxID=37625 RepID=A0A1H3VZ51_9BACT|nr:RDD family protein [Desulfuromusa kysingii]SDZ79328.1 MJ0042 family finger-like domain-containing protein [Desulfuromusa kysingii]
MQITCPHCGFNKVVDQVPENARQVYCPRCKTSFPLHPTDTEPQAKVAAKDSQTDVLRAPISPHAEIDALPKAGFWMRLVATTIDAFIVLVLQLLFGALLAFTGGIAANYQGASVNIATLVQLFSFVLSFAYYIIFTGSCGQTPGKMALRIKVIRRDGSQISYLRAAFREVPAKFISGIIFGIGYLMVAFDEQKQGLHDRMADTYVIKL